MTNAERQARFRKSHANGQPKVRYRRPVDRRSRPAVAELVASVEPRIGPLRPSQEAVLREWNALQAKTRDVIINQDEREGYQDQNSFEQLHLLH